MLGLTAVWLIFLSCALAASASTITGNIRDTSGNAYATNALFTPLSTPQADGANIIASTPTNVIAASDGSFSVTLKQGNYKVNIGNVPNDTFVVSVPNDSSTYSLTALISTQLTYSYPVSPIYEQKINKGVANGYASLDASAFVPLTQLAPTVARYDFIAQLTTTDNTTNNIYAFTPVNNSVVRVFVHVVGWNSTSSASYGKVGTFKNVSGTVTQVGAASTVGLAEDDAAFECLLDTASNQVRVRVAGNTGKTVNWTVWGTLYYAP